MTVLVRAESDDGVEIGGLAGGVDAEEDAGGGGHRRPARTLQTATVEGKPTRTVTISATPTPPSDADGSAEQRHGAGLDEELQQDVSGARAPRALRMPISRVRSVTQTSMMFMMTMPPTTSEMSAMAPATAPKELGDGGEEADEGVVGVELEGVGLHRGRRGGAARISTRTSSAAASSTGPAEPALT